MFIMEGAPAVLLGLFCLFILSDKPSSAPWLDSDQKSWLNGRLQSESGRSKRVGQDQRVARAVEQTCFDFERDAGREHGREQRPANLAAADHQVLRPYKYADWTAQFHPVRDWLP